MAWRQGRVRSVRARACNSCCKRVGDMDSSIDRSKPRVAESEREPRPPAMSGTGALDEPKD